MRNSTFNKIVAITAVLILTTSVVNAEVFNNVQGLSNFINRKANNVLDIKEGDLTNITEYINGSKFELKKFNPKTDFKKIQDDTNLLIKSAALLAVGMQVVYGSDPYRFKVVLNTILDNPEAAKGVNIEQAMIHRAILGYLVNTVAGGYGSFYGPSDQHEKGPTASNLLKIYLNKKNFNDVLRIQTAIQKKYGQLFSQHLNKIVHDNLDKVSKSTNVQAQLGFKNIFEKQGIEKTYDKTLESMGSAPSLQSLDTATYNLLSVMISKNKGHRDALQNWTKFTTAFLKFAKEQNKGLESNGGNSHTISQITNRLLDIGEDYTKNRKYKEASEFYTLALSFNNDQERRGELLTKLKTLNGKSGVNFKACFIDAISNGAHNYIDLELENMLFDSLVSSPLPSDQLITDISKMSNNQIDAIFAIFTLAAKKGISKSLISDLMKSLIDGSYEMGEFYLKEAEKLYSSAPQQAEMYYDISLTSYAYFIAYAPDTEINIKQKSAAIKILAEMIKESDDYTFVEDMINFFEVINTKYTTKSSSWQKMQIGIDANHAIFGLRIRLLELLGKQYSSSSSHTKVEDPKTTAGNAIDKMFNLYNTLKEEDRIITTNEGLKQQVLSKQKAAEGTIRKMYKKLAVEFHPDRNPNDKENATKKFKEMVDAYEAIKKWYE